MKFLAIVFLAAGFNPFLFAGSNGARENFAPRLDFGKMKLVLPMPNFSPAVTVGTALDFFMGGGRVYLEKDPALAELAEKAVRGVLTPSEKDAFISAYLRYYDIANGYSVGKYNQQNTALRKIKLNTYDPADNARALLTLKKEFDLSPEFVVKDLEKGGFTAEALSDLNGGYMFFVKLGKNPGDDAVGLAKYYYVKNVFVGKKVYEDIFPNP